MNKYLVILFAVCLVSVHAFVKRDTEAAQPDAAQAIQNFVGDAAKQIQQAFNPDEIKKGFNKFVDEVSSALKPGESKPEEAKQ